MAFDIYEDLSRQKLPEVITPTVWKVERKFFNFVVCNLLHPWPSLFLYGLLLSLWCFSIFAKCFFLGFIQFNVNFVDDQKNLKIPWLCSLGSCEIKALFSGFNFTKKKQ